MSTICRAALCAALTVMAAQGLAAERAALGFVRLFEGPVQAADVVDTTIYVVQSNALLRADLGQPEWEVIGRIPLSRRQEAVRRLLAVPGAPVSLYALTYHQICLSRDAGATWSFRRLDAEDCMLNDIYVYPETPQTLLVATSDGAWISRDGGNTFDRFFSRNDDAQNQVESVIRVADASRIYLATRGGLFCSGDGGQTFQRFDGLPDPHVTRLVDSPASPNTLAFVSAGRLFFSNTRLDAYMAVSLEHDFGQCLHLDILPNGTDIVWSSPEGVMYGAGWLSGRDTRVAQGMMAAYPAFEQVARDMTSLVASVSAPQRTTEEEPPALDEGDENADVEEEEPPSKPFLRPAPIDLEAASED